MAWTAGACTAAMHRVLKDCVQDDASVTAIPAPRSCASDGTSQKNRKEASQRTPSPRIIATERVGQTTSAVREAGVVPTCEVGHCDGASAVQPGAVACSNVMRTQYARRLRVKVAMLQLAQGSGCETMKVACPPQHRRPTWLHRRLAASANPGCLAAGPAALPVPDHPAGRCLLACRPARAVRWRRRRGHALPRMRRCCSLG